MCYILPIQRRPLHPQSPLGSLRVVHARRRQPQHHSKAHDNQRAGQRRHQHHAAPRRREFAADDIVLRFIVPMKPDKQDQDRDAEKHSAKRLAHARELLQLRGGNQRRQESRRMRSRRYARVAALLLQRSAQPEKLRDCDADTRKRQGRAEPGEECTFQGEVVACHAAFVLELDGAVLVGEGAPAGLRAGGVGGRGLGGAAWRVFFAGAVVARGDRGGAVGGAGAADDGCVLVGAAFGFFGEAFDVRDGAAGGGAAGGGVGAQDAGVG